MLHLSWILQRFLNAIPDMRNIKFSITPSQLSAKWESRCETLLFSNVNEAHFDKNDKKVLHLSWNLQRFLNAISDMRNIKFSHQETQENGKSKSRSENIVFSNVNGALFDQNDQKVLRICWFLQRIKLKNIYNSKLRIWSKSSK